MYICTCDTVYVDNFTRTIFQFINFHVTLISWIIHVYGIHVHSGKDLDAFNFAKTCHRKIKVTLKLSSVKYQLYTYNVLYMCTCDYTYNTMISHEWLVIKKTAMWRQQIRVISIIIITHQLHVHMYKGCTQECSLLHTHTYMYM